METSKKNGSIDIGRGFFGTYFESTFIQGYSSLFDFFSSLGSRQKNKLGEAEAKFAVLFVFVIRAVLAVF